MNLASGPEMSGKKGFNETLDFMISMNADILSAGEINLCGHYDPFFFNSLARTFAAMKIGWFVVGRLAVWRGDVCHSNTILQFYV